MQHDELCPQRDLAPADLIERMVVAAGCRCALIARVRADERTKAAGRVERLTAYRTVEECQGDPLENADPNDPDPYLRGHLLDRDDTLAALERGRVETLREARKHVSAAIDGYREAAPDAWAHISADVEQTFDAMRDRLIDAATTGGVIDMGFLSLPAEVQGELTDHAATTGDTDD